MRYTTAGESHGPALVAVVTGVPAGILVEQSLIDADLVRRQRGYGRGGRMKIETDRARVLSGIRFSHTLGSPVALLIENRDWENWTVIMAPFGEATDEARISTPRPGHADLSGVLKSNRTDVRDILERASARETAARVAAGAIAKAFLRGVGVEVHSWVQSIGNIGSDLDTAVVLADAAAIEASEVRCPEKSASAQMIDAIASAREDGDSLGGVFVVAATGLVPGLGTYAEASGRLDARLAAAVMSIPAIKGVEIGDGFADASLPGSAVHDEIEHIAKEGFRRRTNRAGGIEGGMTNGETVVVRGAMKPIPTLMRPLGTVDIDTHQPADASRERSDVCAVPAAAVVAEAEVALVLADAYLDKFGRDAMSDILAALDAYRERVLR